MITIPIIITRLNKTEPLEWPEHSYPLHYAIAAGMGTTVLIFPDSRFLPHATLEMISFVKLQGFTIMEAPGGTVVFRNNIYIMGDTLSHVYGSPVVRTNAV